MKKTLWATIVLMAIMGASVPAVGSARQAEDPGVLLRAAIEKEEVDGDLQAAIDLYQKIVAKFSDRSAVAAKAQLRIGICYEKMGNAEAAKAYEAVLNRFPKETEAVTEARARLAELKKEAPKGLSVSKLDLFETPGMSIQPIEVFPDGVRMVGVEVMKGQNIVVYDLETKQVKFITEHTWDTKQGYCWTYSPVLSPDAKEIAYCECCVTMAGSAGNSLCVATLDGRSRVLATDMKEWFVPTAWLPDGSAVLTIKGGEPDEAHQLGLVPREGGGFKKLATLQGKAQVLGREYATASVSPDGRYILFTDTAPGEQSDIYIIGTEGGTPKPLIRHPAGEKYPRWSPDGKSAVFLSLRHGNWALWGVAVRDGQAVGEPFLIQDGMKDTFLLNWTAGGLASWSWIRISDIYLMDVDPATGEPAGEPRQLDYVPTGGNKSPVWSPDGRSFAFYKPTGTSDVSIIVVSGSDRREFPFPAGSYASIASMRWTPDSGGIGALVTYKDDPEKRFFLRLSLDSGIWEKRPLPIESFTEFDWSGSGKAIFLSQTGTQETGAGIFELDLETDAKRYVYRPTKETGGVMIRWLKSSRDFKRLAFIVNNTDIMVVDLGSGGSHRAGSKLGHFSWSPDGRRLLADGSLNLEAPKRSLFLLSAEGGPAKEIDISKSLPPRSEIRTPDWSPDGKKVVFMLSAEQGGVFLYRNVIPPKK